MAKQYVVEKRETLKKIARERMGDAALATTLADFNGIVGDDRLEAGQVIEIPSQRDLAPSSVPHPRAAGWPAVPHGLQGALQTFGNLYRHIRDDGTINPRWETERIATCALPFPLPLDWDTSKSATRVRCHKLLLPLFEEVFRQIVAKRLQGTLRTYGGCYQYRAKRGAAKPSTHSWGIAIDFNVRTNQMGTAGDMDPRLVALMEGLGFLWGGRWAGRGKDPMHFQYCTGY